MTLSRLVDAGQHVEHGGLSGSVRTYETVELVLFYLKAEVFDGVETAEGYAEIFYFEHTHFAASPFFSVLPSFSTRFETASLKALNFGEALSIIIAMSATA